MVSRHNSLSPRTDLTWSLVQVLPPAYRDGRTGGAGTIVLAVIRAQVVQVACFDVIP